MGIGIALTYGPRGSSSTSAENGATPGKDALLVSAKSPPGNLDAATEASAAKRLPSLAPDKRDAIRLLAGSFDPLADSLPAPRGIPLRSEITLAPNEPQYWLAQIRGERFAEVMSAVRKAGGTVAGVIPDNAFMVRATPTQRAEIARSRAVRWIGYYQPAWRVPAAARGKKGLLDLVGKRTYRVYLFRDDPNPKATQRALAKLRGVRVLEDAGVVIDVRATAGHIPAIAALPAVQWIGVRPRAVPLNVNARWVNDTGVRDLYAATAAGRLNGAGQTAAVADTGLNYTYDLNGRAHIGFRDCNANGTGCKTAIYTQVEAGNSPAQIDNIRNNATAHRKMVAYFDLGETGPNMYDESSHGSHTAGSTDGDQPPYNQYTDSDGLAPAAEHVHQNIADSGGGLGGLPADSYDLWRQAYRPRDPASVAETSGATGNPGDYVAPGYRPLEDARTHNNSYGLIVPVIDDGSAVALDQFVWDHEDMAIVVSAGNEGPNPATIGSPSVAKNELSSGASANGRQPMASIDSMASFSSHGPTGDGRFGVDLATPGQIVVSVKGGTTDDYHTAQGTSMSGPILTGLATLVRQYFYDGYAASGGDGYAAGAASPSRRHNPSAALVKATLINGAVRMRGRYTGDAGTNPAFDGQWPSGGQGFGRVNLDNSLYFTNDPARTWYADVYRGDTGNPNPNLRPFGVGVGATRTFQIPVQAGEPLDVTLSWTDAPNLLPAGTPALVNNLDLVVTGPGGATYVGNNMNTRTLAGAGLATAETLNSALAPRDVSNLTERVRVATPTPGIYTIRVEAPQILPTNENQGFALAASGRIGSGFTPGPPRQRDASGSPSISNIRVETISANTARIFFDTNEPTTATANVVIGGNPTTFVDSYNVGNTTPTQANFPGLNAGPSETSMEYADRPVVGTKHEILITGLAPGQAASATLTAEDLGSNQDTEVANLTSPTGAYQADAPDIGQLYEDPVTAAQVGQWKTGTQLYASDNGDGAAILGAFAFRIPPAAVNPANINAAAVELTSSHDWVNRYTEDPIYNVDLLDEIEVEGNWGTQDYNDIKSATPDARVFPETTHRRGAYYKHDFTFRCADLQSLRDTLTTLTAGQRMAAFRWETQPANVGLLAMEFGFNRRSRGPAERPKLLLFTGQSGYPDGRPCDPATPAPTISNVGIHGGHDPEQVTVSWNTDVPSNSMVIFREKGASNPWIQVATPVLTKVHAVQVFGLDSTKEYEFAVRSAACNGATTTDTNGGAGYDFFRTTNLGTPTFVASYDFESGDQGWTVQSSTAVPPQSSWVRRTNFASTTNGWHVSIDPPGTANSYSDEDTTTLTSPAQTFSGPTAAVRFLIARDMEPTFDFVHVEYSNNGTTWTDVEQIDGTNPEYPDYESAPREVRFANPGGMVQVRFRFASDQLVSSPVHLGASIDEVSFWSYPMAEQGGGDNLPLVGPVPPPSAGGLSGPVPATRTGAANQADIDAGTGFCTIPAGQQPPPGGNKPDLVVSELEAVNNRPDDDDDDWDNDGRKDHDDDDDDNDGRRDHDDDDDDNDKRRDGRARKGDKVTITATVRNIGTATAGSSRTEFKIDGQVVALVNTGSISPGGQRKVSIVWNTRNEDPGPHVIEATADRNNQVNESNESNNSRTLVYTVQQNQAGNGDFEHDDDDDDRPDHWSDSHTAAGTASWTDGGSNGLKSVALSATGGSAATGSPSWTSAPIAVTSGTLMDLQLSVLASGTSSAASAGLVYLGPLGNVVDRVTLLTVPLSTAGFTTLEQAVTIPAGVAKVQVVLTGFASTDVATAGTVTFDDVGLFER